MTEEIGKQKEETKMKNWTEKPYLYPKNILRTRTRKSKAGELLQSARKLDVESVQMQRLCAGEWVVAMFRHQPGVGEVTGIVRNSRGRKILAPVSYVFNPKLARWKPGPIDARKLGQVLRITAMDFTQEIAPRRKAKSLPVVGCVSQITRLQLGGARDGQPKLEVRP